MPVLQSDFTGYSYETSGKKIIKRAMRLIGALDPDEELTAGELSSCLEALNKMLDSWNAESLMLYALQMYSVATAVRSVSLGPGGVLDMPRPEQLDEGQVFLKDGTINYRVRSMTRQQWALWEADTVSTGLPGRFYYDNAAPTGTLNFTFTPDKAYTLEVYIPVMLAQISKAEAPFTLPPSYADALDYNLAVRIQPEFPAVPLSEIVAELAVSLKAKIQRKNLRIDPAKPDLALPGQGGIWDVNSNSFRF